MSHPEDPAERRRGSISHRVLRGGTEPDPRFTLANERTFLAWIRTSLAFLAGGIAIEAFTGDIFDIAVRKFLAENPDFARAVEAAAAGAEAPDEPPSGPATEAARAAIRAASSSREPVRWTKRIGMPAAAARRSR